jgi:hypothetical protein
MKPWFSGAPVNAELANGLLTFAGTPVVTQTVTIGTEVYEFVTATASTPTNIPVILAATPTADYAVTKLAEAISSNSIYVDAVASTPNDTVYIVSRKLGTEANSVATTETCTNASWGEVTLTGGKYATPCKTSMALIEIGGVQYQTVKPVTKWTTDGWKSIASTTI